MMAIRTRKQKAKIARGLAIATAIILLLIFVVKEILKDNLQELHDSLVSAETQFRNESGQSAISMQILTVQMQIQNLKLEAEKGRTDPQHDYSALIAQDIIAAQQFQANLNADFDSASRLSNKLPAGARDLRQQRDQVHTKIEGMNQQVNDTLEPNPKHDVWRLIDVKLAIVMTILEELPVVVLGDTALTAAQQVQGAAEALIRICTRALYVLGLLFLGLGLYATIAGLKTEAAE